VMLMHGRHRAGDLLVLPAAFYVASARGAAR
jgi:hypothetical protein